jgi:hypothetical protein
MMAAGPACARFARSGTRRGTGGDPNPAGAGDVPQRAPR